MRLSILMPVYNERGTLLDAVKNVLDTDCPCEIELVIVDDGSTDGSRELSSSISGAEGVRIQVLRQKSGKGALSANLG